MVGPLSDQFTLAMGYHHYGGGMWRVLENLFCELPEWPLFSAVFLTLLSSNRASGRKEALCHLAVPCPLQLRLSVPAVIYHFPATSTWFCCDGKVGRAMPFQGRKLRALLSSRHSVKAAAQLLPCYLASWSSSGHGTASGDTTPVLSPVRPPLLLPVCPLPTRGSFRRLCWTRGPLLSFTCMTRKFKGRNNGVFLLCHDAYDTLMLVLTINLIYFINLIFPLLPDNFSLKYDFIRYSSAQKPSRVSHCSMGKPTLHRVHDRFLWEWT